MLDQVKDLEMAEDDLEAFVATGRPAMADLFQALLQAQPGLVDPKEMDPEYSLNGLVAEEVRKLPDLEGLRYYTMTDQISAALSAASLEPKMEVLFDKLKQLQEEANRLKEMLQQFSASESREDEILQQLAEGGLSEEEIEALKSELNDLQEQQQALQEAAQQLAGEIDDESQDQGYTIRTIMAEGLKETMEKAEGAGNFAQVWGNDPGELKKMDPTARLELAEKLDNPRMRDLAKLIGPMLQNAMGAQRNRVHYVPEEVYDVEMGDDLTRLLPLEWMGYMVEELELDFLRRYTEHQLNQRVLRGHDKLAQGGIIALSDGSGSMNGAKERWAMAMNLALLRICRHQKRPFTGIQFAGPGHWKKWVFDTTGKTFSAEITYGGNVWTVNGVEAVIDYASTFLSGGTAWEDPLGLAIEQLQREFDQYGAIRGDVVLVTDGLCSVSAEWQEWYFEQQKKLEFKTFGVAIGCSPSSQPLATLCNEHVIGVTDLVAGAARDLFGAV